LTERPDADNGLLPVDLQNLAANGRCQTIEIQVNWFTNFDPDLTDA
jgi:hypothetical protein